MATCTSSLMAVPKSPNRTENLNQTADVRVYAAVLFCHITNLCKENISVYNIYPDVNVVISLGDNGRHLSHVTNLSEAISCGNELLGSDKQRWTLLDEEQLSRKKQRRHPRQRGGRDFQMEIGRIPAYASTVLPMRKSSDRVMAATAKKTLKLSSHKQKSTNGTVSRSPIFYPVQYKFFLSHFPTTITIHNLSDLFHNGLNLGIG